MKAKLVIIALTAAISISAFAYNDHRGHNVDSLERAVARWTPDAIDRAGTEDLVRLNIDYRNLMLGYQHINQEKCLYYARKALDISLRQNWLYANADALRYIGQYFYAREQYDSALVYFNDARGNIEKMVSGVSSPTRPEGYSERDIDDILSALYGAIGNLYNMMDDIPQAMEYYRKAGELFDKNGWNESNSILYYNIGETWVDEGDFNEAEKAYRKSLDYGLVANDSLMVANAKKGLGRLYMEKGNTWKALNYLHQADEYYSNHDLEEAVSRKEIFQYMSLALEQQRKLLSWLLAGLVLLVLLVAGVLVLVRRLRHNRKVQAETAAVMEEVLQEIKPQRAEDIQLSPREKDILDFLSKGYTTPQIGQALGLSAETIRWYRKKLIAKLDASNTAELISMAKEKGLI